ncbi:hypothetical protein AC626_23025, partial [Pseudoalteromonas rubra]
MNQEELENLIQDHYRGEAQTLSKGSEETCLNWVSCETRSQPRKVNAGLRLRQTMHDLIGPMMREVRLCWPLSNWLR